MRKFDCICAIKALGEEHRLQLVKALMKKDRCVNDLAEVIGMSQYNVSKHLRILSGAGLVEARKDGQLRFYALAGEFRKHLSENKHVLDLGCCQFDFKKL